MMSRASVENPHCHSQSALEEQAGCISLGVEGVADCQRECPLLSPLGFGYLWIKDLTVVLSGQRRRTQGWVDRTPGDSSKGQRPDIPGRSIELTHGTWPGMNVQESTVVGPGEPVACCHK